ncbi:hypothetical protein [Plantibacter sp. 2H11-2]|uniref:hypothetical protein n=1 Tax=Plantibacter sp. 2H11-2 TaxID=3414431 RepID=UPI003CEFD71D
MTSRWHNLVTETQFATELVRSGIARVCELPMNGNRPDPLGYDEVYPLNVGLYMYTSGLERLCKLALACHGFASTGTFAPVRKYSHHLSKLLDALEKLDLANLEAFHPEYLQRPSDEFGDDLVKWLERYSSGEGRYEILDSLTKDDTDIQTWDVWVEFCSRGVVSADVEESISIRYAIGNAVRDICNANDLESAAHPLLEETTRPLYSASAAVGLAMYRRARWAAEVLASVTYYTHEDLPILREGVDVLTQTTDNFFAYEVAGISDREPVIEELTHHFETFVDPAEAEDEG